MATTSRIEKEPGSLSLKKKSYDSKLRLRNVTNDIISATLPPHT